MFYDAKQAARSVVADSMGSMFWGDKGDNSNMGDPVGRIVSFFLPGFPEFSRQITHAQADVLRAYVALLNAQIAQLDPPAPPPGAGYPPGAVAPERVPVMPEQS